MIIFMVVIILIVLWSVVGYFSSRVEHTQYSVLHKMMGYEIREYPVHIVAEATVTGSYKKALKEGFRIVAAYIFGGNRKRESIAMTAPVTESSESIAMTAPVTATTQGESHIISFGMPSSYSLNTLPQPIDPRVKIVRIPRKKFAVLKFSWSRADSRVKRMEMKLLSLLKRDKVAIVSSPIYAGYDAPWTPPWMVHNEVMVEIT
jgi:hypothetical protein